MGLLSMRCESVLIYNPPMSGTRLSHRRMHSAWRTLMCLALFAFVLRAVVPAGFMPDPGALKNGAIRVTFCSADRATTHLALNFGHQEKSSPSHHAGAMGCPFAMLAAQALGTSAGHVRVPVPALTELGIAHRDVLYRVQPWLKDLGPPLGSRAPPLRFV